MKHQTLITAVAIDAGLQAFGWALSCVLKTEKYYDMFGSATFISIIVSCMVSFLGGGEGGIARKFVLSALVLIWALRLGGFLVYRVFKTGSDSRFDEVKANPGKFAVYWTMQFLWVFVTLLPVLLVIDNAKAVAFVWSDSIGLLLFCAGFAVEAVSDLQKFVFKMDPRNEGKFITSGLWSLSRHPNYFGEMVLWWGIYVTSVPALTGAQHAAVLSPIALTLLLCFVSGIPILERSADKRWGGDETYEDYKAKTPVLVPWIHTGFLEPTYDA